MPPAAARCTKARFLFVFVAVGLSGQAAAQPDERDALIQELRQRMEALEKKLGERSAPPQPPAAAPAQPPAAAPQPPPAGAPAKSPAAASKAPAAPTESEEAATADEGARALERALVREGGLVLPRGVIEVEPRLDYTYRGTEGLNLVTINGIPQVAPQDVRSNKFEASVAVRYGLPKSFQAEVRVPYVWIDQNRATLSAVGESERVSGLGDIELGLSKQLATARRGGVLASLIWKSTTGEHEPGRPSPGAGFPSLQAALTAVTREDPLVFFISPSYTYIFTRERNGVDVNPGNAIGLKAGALLAASPETSLRASFELSHAARTRVATQDVAGSDTTVALLEIGLAKVLTRSTLLDVQLGVGLTSDTPDFRLRFALPIRFGPKGS